MRKKQITVYRLDHGATSVMFRDGKNTRLYRQPTSASLYRLQNVVVQAVLAGLCHVRPWVGHSLGVGWVMEKRGWGRMG